MSFDSIVKTSIIDPKSIKSIIGEEESLKEEDPNKSLKERNRELEQKILERKKLEQEEEINKDKASGRLKLSPAKKSFSNLSSFAEECVAEKDTFEKDQVNTASDDDSYLLFIDIEDDIQKSSSKEEIGEIYLPSAELLRNTSANRLIGKISQKIERK